MQQIFNGNFDYLLRNLNHKDNKYLLCETKNIKSDIKIMLISIICNLKGQNQSV